MPVHLHVEEQRREIEESLAAYGRTPMAVILDAVEEGAFTAVHCTHTSDEDMARFLAAGGTVCLCPLTEGNLGDGIPRLGRPHATGGRLAIGTDSNNRLVDARRDAVARVRAAARGEMRGAPARCGGGGGADLARRGHHRAAPRAVAAGRANRCRAAGPTSSRSTSARPPLAETPTERLLAAIVFGAGNEVIAGTYVGGTWRASGAA